MAVTEARQHHRIFLHVPVRWTIDSQGLAGEGRLLDVSLTGARILITGAISTTRGAVFTLDAPAIPALPHTARLRWFRRESGLKPNYVCGVVFAQEAVDDVPWRAWIATRLNSERRTLSHRIAAGSRQSPASSPWNPSTGR